MPNYWWVNHKQTFKHEIEGDFLWSPKFKSNGERNYFYDTMADAEVGDIVLSYANGKISYFGIVIEEPSSAKKPDEFGSAGDDWDNNGWFLPISWQKIIPAVKPKLVWDEIQHLFPKKYSPLNKYGGGSQGCYLAEISEQIFLTVIQYSLEKNPVLFSTIHSSLSIASSALRRQITEIRRTVSQRIGQLQFRNEVIKLERACPITGVASPAFLRASHVKPWRVCETAEERLDPQNGLALAPHIDQLFDQGYITFDTNGTLVLSDDCPPMIPVHWVFEDKIGKSLIDVSERRKKYLAYHNRHVFKN